MKNVAFLFTLAIVLYLQLLFKMCFVCRKKIKQACAESWRCISVSVSLNSYYCCCKLELEFNFNLNPRRYQLNLYPWVKRSNCCILLKKKSVMTGTTHTLMTLFQCSYPLGHDTLKVKYTFGNYQRPVSSLRVSHRKHKITSMWQFGLNRSSKLRENDVRKNSLVGRICVLSDRSKKLLAQSLLLF